MHPFIQNLKQWKFALAALMVAVLYMAPWPVQSRVASPMPAAQRESHRALTQAQDTPVPVETATPLPTLPPDPSGGQGMGKSLMFAGILMCGMAFLLAAGVGAAILLVRLREKIR